MNSRRLLSLVAGGSLIVGTSLAIAGANAGADGVDVPANPADDHQNRNDVADPEPLHDRVPQPGEDDVTVSVVAADGSIITVELPDNARRTQRGPRGDEEVVVIDGDYVTREAEARARARGTTIQPHG